MTPKEILHELDAATDFIHLHIKAGTQVLYHFFR